MSAYYKCLDCGHMNEVETDDLILLAENPQDKAMAIDLQGPGIMPICAKCGEPMPCPRRVLYIDRDKKFAVRYAPPWAEPLPFHPEQPGYALREVLSALVFREKIYLLDQGLDDVVVELLKLVTIQANPGLSISGQYCSQAREDRLIIEALCEGAEDISYNVPMKAYDNMASSLRTAKGESWRPEGFARVDIVWIMQNVLEPAG